MKKGLIVALGCVLLLAGSCGLLSLYHRWRYPYGASHCCIKQFSLYFNAYAHQHDGQLPAGGSSPEASLSLIYREQEEGEEMAIQILRGKTVPTMTVQAVLESGELLSPETCGWHYVEGLKIDDDPRIAVVWDKTPGLSHNGERTSDGGREVAFLSGSTDWIPGDQWEKFLEEQAKLIAARADPAK